MIKGQLSPFSHSLEEWKEAGYTYDEWKVAGIRLRERIQASPHFHDWKPCGAVHKVSGQRG